MGKAKTKIASVLFFVLLVVFPFGQIIRVGKFQPLDFVVGLIFLYCLIYRLPKPLIFKYWQNFILVAVFSYLLNPVSLGWFYLIRLVIYLYLFVFVRQIKPKLAIDSLLLVAAFVAIFGWLQYFFYPDLRALTWLGWDDHYYRLVGTFLDPAFTAIILVLGSIIALVKKKNLLFFFLMISLAFTYSRAGYLAFFASFLYLNLTTKNLKKFLLYTSCFILLVILLPRPGGLGVELERTVTISSRLTNYQEGLAIFAKSPLFGVGFNNLCAFRKDPGLHSCFGLDSSLLLVLATTGVVGLLIFIYALFKSFYLNRLFSFSLVAVLVHSLFSNSLFYPWVMAWLAILGGVADRK
jgi:hypothetical protein